MSSTPVSRSHVPEMVFKRLIRKRKCGQQYNWILMCAERIQRRVKFPWIRTQAMHDSEFLECTRTQCNYNSNQARYSIISSGPKSSAQVDERVTAPHHGSVWKYCCVTNPCKNTRTLISNQVCPRQEPNLARSDLTFVYKANRILSIHL